MGKSKRNWRNVKSKYIDYNLLAILASLLCFGLLMLYSTSSYSALLKYGNGMYYFKKQVLFILLGLIAMGITGLYPYQWYQGRMRFGKLHFGIKWPIFLYYGAIVAMLLVHSPIGIEVNGAKRWIHLGLFQLQPSELAKIAIIISIPVLICRMGNRVKSLGALLKLLIIGTIQAVCAFVVTNNLSAAAIILGITVVLIFVAYPKTKIFFWIGGIGITALVAARILLPRYVEEMMASGDFRLRRVLVWLNPEAYAKEGGYQTIQALYAISSGGFFGKGLGNSTQKMIIPEVQNDMVLSVICEELGIFGAILVLLLFGLLIYRLAVIAQNAPDVFGTLIATGILAHIFIQVSLNVAVVTNLIPNTGITLPFISYGGSATILLMAEMGMALNISSQINME